MEEVELGGLEDDDGNGAVLVGLDDEEYRFSSIEDREEVTILYKMFYHADVNSIVLHNIVIYIYLQICMLHHFLKGRHQYVIILHNNFLSL